MTLRQLFASAARFLGFAPRGRKHLDFERPSQASGFWPVAGDTSSGLADAFSRMSKNPPQDRRDLGAIVTSNPTRGDFYKRFKEAQTDKSAAELVDEWRARHPDVVAAWDAGAKTEYDARGNPHPDGRRGPRRYLPLNTAPTPVTPEPPLDIIQRSDFSVVTSRKSAQLDGLAYWVEGPKADGLFWLYHRKTPDDRAEPVRGYTRRRNAQARAITLRMFGDEGPPAFDGQGQLDAGK